jgi:inosine-uridine nucleoside N-ribohydrolase/formylmethanofuran dehydrogenase subunit E
MKKYLAFLYLLFLSCSVWAKPLPVQTKHTIIIDTDCAIDDLRAISLLLASPEITIKAIFVSDGTLPPNEGVKKLKALLHEFHRDTIPVACGDVLKGVNPPWRDFNRQIIWGSNSEFATAVENISEKFFQANEKVILVCLGPLTNENQLINKNAAIKNRIERIVWYNGSIKPMQGFNYECDKKSADDVFSSGLRIDVISNLKKEDAIFDTSMFAVCANSKTPLGNILYKVHNQAAVLEQLKNRHFRMCDELVSLYITNPELFDITTLKENKKIRYNQEYDVASVREAMSDMIAGTYVAERNIVFNIFPNQREMFTYDVRQIMDSAIAHYGYNEWKANVMTDEFHGHLGVYSIVGAKMGIKARELFGVGPDQLEVLSFAGTRPPYSCLNDGIQVSTGATLGQGLIKISNDSLKRPEAIFSYKGRMIKISLKKDYLRQVDSDIDDGILQFGLMDDGYWKLIRRNALKYWLEWDRSVIFDIEEVK